MAKVTPEIIAELKARHGQRLYLIEDEEAGDIVFKPANKEAWGEFVDSVNADTDAATRTLFDACVVFPSVEECQRLHDEFPALADPVALQIRNKSGGRPGLAPKRL